MPTRRVEVSQRGLPVHPFGAPNTSGTLHRTGPTTNLHGLPHQLFRPHVEGGLLIILENDPPDAALPTPASALFVKVEIDKGHRVAGEAGIGYGGVHWTGFIVPQGEAARWWGGGSGVWTENACGERCLALGILPTNDEKGEAVFGCEYSVVVAVDELLYVETAAHLKWRG